MEKQKKRRPEQDTEQVRRQIQTIIDKYHRPLCKYAYQLVKSYEIASDIVQDTWLEFFHYFLQQERPLLWLEQANIPALLWTITRNKAMDFHRSRKGMISLDTEQITTSFEPHVPPYDLPEAQAIRANVHSALYDAVNALPEKYRSVIAFYYFYGYSQSEIAQRLKLCPGTVKAQMCRGRALLQDLLEKRGITPRDLDVWEIAEESFPKYVLQEEAHVNSPLEAEP